MDSQQTMVESLTTLELKMGLLSKRPHKCRKYQIFRRRLNSTRLKTCTISGRFFIT
ncbi:hypothetical protein E4U58_001731 [Claviceps cyperi]|nr:hypothetical protein E4U58_001731 [Claviceps cyperi]